MRLPNSASASSKNSNAPLSSQASNTSRSFFSVSPMYLLTTPAEIDAQQFEAEARAITCAAMVLPVPDGPPNSAEMPWPRWVEPRETPFLVDGPAQPHLGLERAQLRGHHPAGSTRSSQS